jgi:signal recognition particle receptor subunit beta
MALFNYATKEITLKVVYYGPGLSGKTTNLQYLHSVLSPATKGKLLSLSTEADRTLFFDFLPIELGKIRDFSIRFQLYTVPGQVRYNATRKVVLKGADAVVFVADSQHEMREQNIESFANMRDNLYSNNINPDDIPIILQYNKRDLKNIAPLDELDQDLNQHNYPIIEATAISGNGVEDSFNLITRLLLNHISKKHRIEIKPAEVKEEMKTEEIPSALETGQPTVIHLRSESGEKSDFGPSELKPDTPGEEKMEKVLMRQIKEVPVLTVEKIDEAVHEIKKINDTLAGLQASLSRLADGMRGIEQVRKEQEASNTTLREIAGLLEDLKTKKRKLKFW